MKEDASLGKVNTLHYEAVFLKNKLKKIYKELYSDFFEEMRKLATQGKNEYIAIVPRTYKNEKNYNIVDCIYYLIKNLKKNGFTVAYVYPVHLFIKWTSVETENDKLKKSKYLVAEDMKSRLTYMLTAKLDKNPKIEKKISNYLIKSAEEFPKMIEYN